MFWNYNGSSWNSPVTVQENGDVGIGTTAPSGIFEAYGQSIFANGSFADPNLGVAYDAKFGGTMAKPATGKEELINGPVVVST